MTEHRDITGRFEADAPDESRRGSTRRFARLVAHPTARRLSVSRLMLAFLAIAAIVGGIYVVGGWALRSSGDWLQSQPSQQIALSDVRLVPPPDPWIRSGSAQFLKAIGSGDRISLLTLDLDELRKSLRLCPWVKDVGRIEKAHGSLTIPLTYYQPVAMAQFEGGRIVIDRDGVILPAQDLAWETADPKSRRLRGRAEPLILLEGFDGPDQIKAGSYWGREGRVDLKVLRAARLADFLTTSAMADGPEAIRFAAIAPPNPPDQGLFASTTKNVPVYWGWSPEVETPGQPNAAEKWAMLRDWVKDHGMPRVTAPNYLYFTPTGLQDHKDTLTRRPTRDP
ncbi:cell division protein FtsQ/DivIB [Tundrisphaera sp. TA3]|uniref:cell division protein FtsQ/DivIB n=1 Tax=Tundrisphaera sp. TA3 TaxID=3435775 RepID=UPI003EBFD3A9